MVVVQASHYAKRLLATLSASVLLLVAFIIYPGNLSGSTSMHPRGLPTLWRNAGCQRDESSQRDAEGTEVVWVIKSGDTVIDTRIPTCSNKGDVVCLPASLVPLDEPMAGPWGCTTPSFPGVWISMPVPISPTSDSGWEPVNRSVHP